MIVILWCFEHALCGEEGFETSLRVVLNSMRGSSEQKPDSVLSVGN